MRDNNRQTLRCYYGTETNIQTIFKRIQEEAVALVREQGYTVPEAAKSLGIASNMLYREFRNCRSYHARRDPLLPIC